MQRYLGTAGWSVPGQHHALFPEPTDIAKPSHLQRYAGRLCCVEINSSFHRPHRLSTWQRWAASTPDHFRFAVKAPKFITHIAKLHNTGAALLAFFQAVRGLGDKLGPVLVQLPPKLAFDEGVAHEFFTTLRELHSGAIALEPRHSSWFTGAVDRLQRDFHISRVAADPPKGSDLAARPGGWPSLTYWRLHGAPRTYYSGYDAAWLRAFAERLTAWEQQPESQESWVILDNTALGHAIADACTLDELLHRHAADPKTGYGAPGALGAI